MRDVVSHVPTPTLRYQGIRNDGYTVESRLAEVEDVEDLFEEKETRYASAPYFLPEDRPTLVAHIVDLVGFLRTLPNADSVAAER